MVWEFIIPIHPVCLIFSMEQKWELFNKRDNPSQTRLIVIPTQYPWKSNNRNYIFRNAYKLSSNHHCLHKHINECTPNAHQPQNLIPAIFTTDPYVIFQVPSSCVICIWTTPNHSCNLQSNTHSSKTPIKHLAKKKC